MAAKILLFDEEARRALERGVNTTRRSSKGNAWPSRPQRGAGKRNTAAQVSYNDGVTIAKEIEVSNPFENMGAQLVREVASKTNDIAGDGTTTATVLAQAMVKEGLKSVAAGAKPLVIKRGIDAAVKAIVAQIAANSVPIEERRPSHR